MATSTNTAWGRLGTTMSTTMGTITAAMTTMSFWNPRPRGRGTDLNLMAAYTHVIADALTSVLAIVALTGGKLWNWSWLDPAMGIVGGLVVGAWAFGLIKSTGKVLLDRETDGTLANQIRGRWSPTATRW